MSRTLAFHPAAREELLAAVDRYEQRRPGLGAAFLAAVQSAAQHALEWPETGGPLGRELRRIFVRRFPYYLLYALERDQLYAVAVGHFRRHPRYWADRQDA